MLELFFDIVPALKRVVAVVGRWRQLKVRLTIIEVGGQNGVIGRCVGVRVVVGPYVAQAVVTPDPIVVPAPDPAINALPVMPAIRVCAMAL